MSIHHRAYRFRGYLVPLPLIFAVAWFGCETEEFFIWPIGIGLFLMGIGLRIWAQQHVHYGLRARKSLTITGPYSFVRNPLYIGNILICLGAVIISELLWLVPITLFYCSWLYSLAVRYEEAHLLDKYGESYRRYREQVPRWFPRVSHLKNLGLLNEYLRQSIVVELPRLLLLAPYIIKEIIHES